jgi:tetratricopeptide (TPR) repeat protein
MSDKVLGRVLGLDRALEPLLPPLLSLLDVPVHDPAWSTLDPRQRRQRTLDAVRRLLLCESKVQPLLVVFEDLHWVDSETQALLERLVDSLSSARLVLLVNYRPEYEHRWGSKSVYSQLRLDPLPADSASELLAAFLGPGPGLEPLTQLLVKRGNPFFLEETLRSLIESGALVGERGAYRLTRPVKSLQVPATVQAILAARIDRLPSQEKQLLQAASAIGKDVPCALLAAIAEQPEEALQSGLAHLQEAEFLYEKRVFPDLELTFKHALTHETTYGGLLHDVRKRRHAQIVAATERLYRDRLGEHIEWLANHAMRGQLWDAAVRYSRQAGTRALNRSAAREAFAAFEQARLALQELPESAEQTRQLIDLCFDQRNALVSLGEFSKLGEVVGEARMLSERLGDERRLACAHGYLALQYGILGEHARAIDAGEQAQAIAASVGDVVLHANANYYLGLALWYAGNPLRAVGPPRAAVALVKDLAPSERFGLVAPPGVLVRFVLALVLAELGEFSEAIAAGEEGLRIAQVAGYPYSEVLARWSFGFALMRRGDFPAAIAVLEPGLALCRNLEIRFALPYFAAFLGFSYVRSDREGKGVELLEEAAEANRAMQIHGHRSLFLLLLAEAYLASGRIEEARESAKEVVALASNYPAQSWELWGIKLLGDIDSHELTDASQAKDCYRQVVSLANGLGMRPLLAHGHLGLGTLQAKTGQTEDARVQLHLAMAHYQAMRMHFWVNRAEMTLREFAR